MGGAALIYQRLSNCRSETPKSNSTPTGYDISQQIDDFLAVSNYRFRCTQELSGSDRGGSKRLTLMQLS